MVHRFIPATKEKMSHSFHTLFWDMSDVLHIFPPLKKPFVWNWWYQHLMLLGDGESLRNCRWKARWIKISVSYSQTAAHKTLPTPESPFSLSYLADHEWAGEGGELGLGMRSKLEYLLFRSIWETYFCVHFQSVYGRLKLLQWFWYMIYLLFTYFICG